jgi:uncharacterized protein YigE (DUF2233 family)
MPGKRLSITIAILGFLVIESYVYATKVLSVDDRFVTYTANASDVKMYWKDNGQNIGSLQNLKTILAKKNQKLAFAMNGGMYKKDQSPQGLYIENGENLSPLDKASGGGNFYLKPNGVFYITDKNNPGIAVTEKCPAQHLKYATQSGPMLVIDGEIHPDFRQGSINVNIRNGVGILPNNKIVFVLSKAEINLYDFAEYFKTLGCKNALYLDGFVSRAYVPPQNWMQTSGNFGIIIGATQPKEKQALDKHTRRQ